MRPPIPALLVAAALAAAPVPPGAASAQEPRDEQFYYPGSFNWQFLERYPEAARLFNAFDYGHAVLYETLLTRRERAAAALEREYRFLTTDLLLRPPRFAVAEEAVMPAYAKLAWRARQMFDWAHVLHRQIYDTYADDRLTAGEKDSLVERLTDYYLSREAYAFTPAPKSMALMEEQYYSRVFRRAHRKFNGLIWAYHWLQIGLYEPLITGRTPAERRSLVQATLARFRAMLERPPSGFPRVMPMAAAVAPRFARAHPRAAVVFDNLHMMHDIISDILASEAVPAAEKRKVIYAALEEFRDSTRNVTTLDEWRAMASHMGGVAAMGGSPLGLPDAPGDPDPGAGHDAHQPRQPGVDSAPRGRE